MTHCVSDCVLYVETVLGIASFDSDFLQREQIAFKFSICCILCLFDNRFYWDADTAKSLTDVNEVDDNPICFWTLLNQIFNCFAGSESRNSFFCILLCDFKESVNTKFHRNIY